MIDLNTLRHFMGRQDAGGDHIDPAAEAGLVGGDSAAGIAGCGGGGCSQPGPSQDKSEGKTIVMTETPSYWGVGKWEFVPGEPGPSDGPGQSGGDRPKDNPYGTIDWGEFVRQLTNGQTGSGIPIGTHTGDTGSSAGDYDSYFDCINGGLSVDECGDYHQSPFD